MEHRSDLATEIPLHFQDETTELARRAIRLPPQELVDVRIHAGRRLAGADGVQDHDAGVEAPLRDGEPLGTRGGSRSGLIVGLAQNKRRSGPLLGLRVRRERPDTRREAKKSYTF
jgi:hypothetical protein